MSDSDAHAHARLVAGRYRLVRELGRGGMGVVWLAVDELVGRPVAVKELRPPQLLADEEHETYGLRALAEARSAARIHHPGAVTLFDVLPASGGDDAVYLIMELVEGPTLAQLIEREGPLPAPAVASYGLQLLSVLLAAHGLGVVHRDIKPANIMIAPGGQAKLTDFGIAHTVGDARLTRSGFMGTQAYTAPELFESAPLTPAADVWSLGATLFAAAEGQGPFDRDTTGATLRAILLDEVPAPRCPPPLAAAITGMLQRDPARRSSIDQARAQLLPAARLPAAAQAPADPTTASMTPASHPGPAARLHVPWDQAATTRAPSSSSSSPPPPAAYPPPTMAPPSSRPRASRRSLLIIAAVAAAAVVTVAVLVPVLLHTGSQATLAATLANPAGSSNAGVTSVAFSPDGKTLAAGDFDGSTYLWDTATHRIVGALNDPGTTSSMNSVVISPDGALLATGGSNAYVWNLSTRQLAVTLVDNGGNSTTEGVNAVAFSPDSATLAAADGNDSTYLWDLATRRVSAILTDPSGLAGQMKAVAFSPDGKTLATGDNDGSTYLWNVATGRLIASLADPEGQGVTSVAFSPDGAMLAAGDSDGSSYVWDVATHRIAATLTSPGGAGVASVAFSRDGTTLAAGDLSGSAFLWDVANGSLAATLTDPTEGPGSSEGVNSVGFSPDGETIAVGDADNSTYLWATG